MGEIFNILIRGLGSILGFFYDLLDGVFDEGVSLGLSIILLTIVVNLLVFPLTLKQTRATRAFTAIQPEIKRIQKEYKDDPQEMQKKLMELQKSAGATPGRVSPPAPGPDADLVRIVPLFFRHRSNTSRRKAPWGWRWPTMSPRHFSAWISSPARPRRWRSG